MPRVALIYNTNTLLSLVATSSQLLRKSLDQEKAVMMRSPAMALPQDLAVRCPYCVTGYEFRIMQTSENSRVCARCGHIVRPDDAWFHCFCPNCLRLYRER